MNGVGCQQGCRSCRPVWVAVVVSPPAGAAVPKKANTGSQLVEEGHAPPLAPAPLLLRQVHDHIDEDGDDSPGLTS